MKLLFLLLLFLGSSMVMAQDGERILIKAGTDPNEVLTRDKIYRFPVFTKGAVHFRDGSVSEAKLNYNFLNGEVEFIDPKGDTLAIAKAQLLNIKEVRIDTSVFYYNDGYLEQVMQNKNGKLLQKQLLVTIKREKIGGYGQPTETSAIDSYSSYNFDGQFRPDLKIREDVTLTKRTLYYFGNQYNVFLIANKKNLLRIFSRQKDHINAFLKTNIIDFTRYSDMQRLFAFIQTL